jgi:hypothetical protein
MVGLSPPKENAVFLFSPLEIAAMVPILNFVPRRNYGDESAWEKLTPDAVAACPRSFGGGRRKRNQ